AARRARIRLRRSVRPLPAAVRRDQADRPRAGGGTAGHHRARRARRPHTTGDDMTDYAMPVTLTRPAAPEQTAYLITSGDLRESANVAGWPTQVELEAGVTRVL